MTPEEIRAWAQQHGGDAGADPPDANGITVYRAADGSFINVRADGSLAMRGRGTPQSPATADATAAPPAAPRGGGAMQQQDVEQWIATQGGQGRVQYTRATKQVDNPAADIDKAKAAGVPFQVGAPEKISVSEEKWSAVDANGKDTGAVLHVSRRPDGSFDIITQSNPNPTAKQTAADPGTPIGSRQVTDSQGKTVKVTTYQRADGTTYEREDSVQAAPEKPQVVQGTLNTSSPYVASIDPATQQITWLPNKNYKNPKPEPLNLPPNQQWAVYRNDDGTTTTEKNPNWQPPSKIQKDETTGKWIEITQDENGKPIVRDVDSQTTIKPADLPVLQSKYGEIAQGLGQLAQDLNSRVARGEITPEERKTAFEAAHAQASTQVAELNSILENSKAIWSGQVTQRGQSLAETQSRRSFASDAAGRAIQAGAGVAAHSGKGSGAAIASGVEALMRMQQQYAQGMGGFKDSPEVGLPPALEQARGMSIPGYGPTAGAPPAPAPPPSGANVAATNAAAMAGSRSAFGALGIPPTQSVVGNSPGGAPVAAAPPPAPPPSGISNTTDAGGVPREYSPASSTVGSGIPPAISGMGSALGAAAGYAGAPVAAGGAGVWNPTATVQGMLGDGSDPAWEEAVRRAAAEHTQGSYGRFG